MPLRFPIPAFFAGADLAVDLGTSAIRVAAIDGNRRYEAPACRGGAPAMRRGVVHDVAAAVAIAGPLIDRARGVARRRLRVVASTPSDVDGAERAAVVEVLRRCGASEVAVFPEPLSAAVGARRALASPQALMLVDVGHGVTDAVVLRGGAVVASATRRVGCSDLAAVLARTLGATPGGAGSTADPESLLRELDLAGLAAPDPGGASAAASEPERETLRRAVAPIVDEILAVPATLAREVPDEIGAELVESGIWLTGGGALLRGLEPALAARTRLDVRRVADPLGAVLEGNRALFATARQFARWES